MMESTSISLLERLRRPEESQAWSRFVELYTPLIYYWCRRVGLQPEESADLVQDVLAVLVQKMPEFNYDPQKTFRGWLRTLTLNKWRENRRRHGIVFADDGQDQLNNVVSPENEEAFWQVEYRQHLLRRALKLMEADFHESSWKACLECIAGRSAIEVAQELGMTVDSVYAAKSRVLRRLREELAGLVE